MTLRTLRGVLPRLALTLPNVGEAIQEYRLNLDNSDINRNFRVVSFEIFPTMSNTARGMYNFHLNPQNCYATLSLDSDGATQTGSFADNRQIAWVAAYGASDATAYRSYVDPNHVVVRDLWIGCYAIHMSDGSTDPISVEWNYSVVIEEVSSTDNQAIVQLIRERSQTDLA